MQAHTLAGKRDRSGLRLWTVPEKVVRHRMGVLSVADPFAKLPQNLPPGGVVRVVNADSIIDPHGLNGVSRF